MQIDRLSPGSWEMTPGPVLLAGGSAAGPREGQGPLGQELDRVWTDLRQEQKSFEQAEQLLQQQAAESALAKAGLQAKDIDLFLAGDLLNQITPSSFTARALAIPFCGVFTACATMAQALSLAALAVSAAAAQRALVLASSHTCTAERQFRYPNEYGSQKPPYSQQTVTAAGAVVLSQSGPPAAPRLRAVTIGQVVDMRITDPFQLGAAMAPAWADTVARHLQARGQTLADYDLILSGDLGRHGGALGLKLLARQGLELPESKYQDCGLLLFGGDERVFAGGSGCGCAAAALAARILPQLARGKLRRVLLVATGALLSPLANQQQETIPGIAHGVELEGGLTHV